ncbi:MAG TPA: cyclopropane-fatty-acyl-phospholipid synthase family protein [Pseudonocardiaceae bacterium]|nr:cyclopropane-fatty-acyl-phospholipid synthase family protein [Pseudonocardiaceae bacterium]
MSIDSARYAIPRPAEGDWPGLATPVHSPLKATAARLLFNAVVRGLPIKVVLPDGRRLGGGGQNAPEMRIRRPADFFNRLGVDGTIGLGEAYMVGDWTTDSLVEVLTPFAARMTGLVPQPLRDIRRWAGHRKPAAEHNTIDGARENIHRHYDLSNDLFGMFLDDTMTYSCAWFAPGTDELSAAQVRKVDAILDYAGVRAGSKVLEIGSGWGTLAIRAAQRGADVTSLTISTEQKELADQRIAEAGVADRARVVMRDYREETGRYDAVVSVEMIEAVGHQYWPDYFGAVDRVLQPGGRFALQAITMPHSQMLATRYSQGWPHKYIFPGGELLSIPEIEYQVAEHTDMRIIERQSLGSHYARTLRHWRLRFLEQWPKVSALGFDETFHRMWEFYLAYFESGFRADYLDVWQLRMDKRQLG